MPDWFPKPPGNPGGVLYSESWIDYFLFSNTGNQILMAVGLVVLGLLATFLLFKKSKS